MANRMPRKVFISPSNAEIIRALGLYYVDPTDNSLTPHYFDATAQVKATLLDQLGNSQAGCTDLALVYVNGSQGNFASVVGANFNPTVGSSYTLRITATQGGANGEWKVDCEVRLRTN